jgi:hypothetical protein
MGKAKRRRARGQRGGQPRSTGLGPFVGLEIHAAKTSDSSKSDPSGESDAERPTDLNWSVDRSSAVTSASWLSLADHWQEVQSEAERICCSFGFQMDEWSWTDVMTGLHAMVLDNLVVAFFNRDLAFAVASFYVVSRNPEYPATQVLYTAEDALTRIARCWEYLFQVVRAFLDLDVVAHRGVKDQALFNSVYDVEFLPMKQGGVSVNYNPRPDEDAIKIIAERRKTLQYQVVDRAAKSIRKQIHRRYKSAPWLDELFRLARDPNVLRVKELRDLISHVGSTASRFRYDLGGGVPGEGVSGNAPLVEHRELQRIVPKAVDATKRAIQAARRAVYHSEIPDEVGTDGTRFSAYRCECSLCGTTHLVPNILYDFYSTTGLARCPNCGRHYPPSRSAPETIVGQYIFDTLLSGYLREGP